MSDEPHDDEWTENGTIILLAERRRREGKGIKTNAILDRKRDPPAEAGRKAPKRPGNNNSRMDRGYGDHLAHNARVSGGAV